MTCDALIGGNDQILLATRQQVLEKGGLSCDIAIGARALSRNPSLAHASLLILCHTLSEKEQKDCIQAIRAVNPAPILVLTLRAGDTVPLDCYYMEWSRGPAALIERAKELIGLHQSIPPILRERHRARRRLCKPQSSHLNS